MRKGYQIFITTALVLAFAAITFLAVFHFISPDTWSFNETEGESIIATEYATNEEGETVLLELAELDR